MAKSEREHASASGIILEYKNFNNEMCHTEKAICFSEIESFRLAQYFELFESSLCKEFGKIEIRNFKNIKNLLKMSKIREKWPKKKLKK